MKLFKKSKSSCTIPHPSEPLDEELINVPEITSTSNGANGNGFVRKSSLPRHLRSKSEDLHSQSSENEEEIPKKRASISDSNAFDAGRCFSELPFGKKDLQPFVFQSALYCQMRIPKLENNRNAIEEQYLRSNGFRRVEIPGGSF